MPFSELESAEHFLFKEAQSKSYAKEIDHLTQNRSIPAHSPLISLNPYLETKGEQTKEGEGWTKRHTHKHDSYVHRGKCPCWAMHNTRLVPGSIYSRPGEGTCPPRLVPGSNY